MPNAQEELGQSKTASSTCLDTGDEDNHKASTQNVKTTSDCKPDQDRDDVNASNQEKLMKKPDKIVPCPRCNSMDTKFCYYNNYNVNQPRHFCKNCQRYWTAGGMMRNVPVGAGRRKSKHSVPHNHHMMLSDGVSCNRPDAPDHVLSCGSSAPIRPLNGNAAILKFGPEAPVCESMASVLNIEDQMRNIDTKSVDCGEKLEVEASNNVEKDGPETAVPTGKNVTQSCFNGVSPIPQLPCYPGPPFVFPWNAGWNNVAAMAAGQFPSELLNGQWNGSPNPIPWRLPMLAAPPFCSPAIPFPFMPASFWGYMSSWPNGAWNVPWMGSKPHLSPPSCTSNSGCSGNGSPALGKHSRDTSLDGEENTERKSLWVPKTLRIDDPDEAAKSSIWATLGIEPDEAIKKGGVFKAFHSKTASKDIVADAVPALHANPAALCRSQKFQEST